MFYRLNWTQAHRVIQGACLELLHRIKWANVNTANTFISFCLLYLPRHIMCLLLWKNAELGGIFMSITMWKSYQRMFCAPGMKHIQQHILCIHVKTIYHRGCVCGVLEHLRIRQAIWSAHCADCVIQIQHHCSTLAHRWWGWGGWCWWGRGWSSH